MKNVYIPIIALLAISIGNAHAQETTQLNFMSEQLSEQLLNQTFALSEPKLVKAQAELLRKHYQALIETGFSKDEALRIIISMSSKDKG